MIEHQVFFHSPFSPTHVREGQAPALLLQFILKELLRSDEYLVRTPSFQIAPFDWATKQGSANKVEEHAKLLPFAFPELAPEAAVFAAHLDSPCVELFKLLEPFILACQKSENLLYFLLKHQNSPSIKLLLDKINPESIDQLKTDVVQQYQQRGFYPSKWTH